MTDAHVLQSIIRRLDPPDDFLPLPTFVRLRLLELVDPIGFKPHNVKAAGDIMRMLKADEAGNIRMHTTCGYFSNYSVTHLNSQVQYRLDHNLRLLGYTVEQLLPTAFVYWRPETLQRDVWDIPSDDEGAAFYYV